MARRHAVRTGQAGFTLIELLVVVMIIGILAAMAIPQYFKVVEKSRTAEAKSFMSSLRSAQEAYLARNGSYTNNIAALDISYTNCSGGGGTCGMKDFIFDSINVGASGCSGNAAVPGYQILVDRSPNSVAAKYTGYHVQYDKCSDQFTYSNCAGSACTDFD